MVYRPPGQGASRGPRQRRRLRSPVSPLPTRPLGSTGPEITTLGFGAWAIGGGDTPFGWGPQDDADSVAAVRRALAEGVTWIDTAPAYGLGHSEEVVARAI